MGQKTFVIGEKPSDASLVKLSGNFLIAATIESLSEAIALARKSGIDAHRYVYIVIAETELVRDCCRLSIAQDPGLATSHSGRLRLHRSTGC
jgi:3-hydroxyisobutyrate dehydrogenase-like beta-hydroxyacid dehydrogenase